MRRRVVVAAAGATALRLPRQAGAQQPGRNYRRGWLSPGAGRSEVYNQAFVQRLSELGFVEERNLTIAFRSVEGRVDKLPELAADLARVRCDVFLAAGPEATLVALERATRDTPIVMAANDYDPVGVEAGGLLSYGVNFPAAHRRAAEQAGIVLNGARPPEMPVEQSTMFELAVNLKTARALGLSIPQAILLRANRVIE